MDKKTAYKVISQFRANNCKSGALAIALDEALKALKPIAVNQVFCIKLEILDSGNYYHSKAAQSTLWLEASNNKKKMQAHIAEWRSKVVERCTLLRIADHKRIILVDALPVDKEYFAWMYISVG